MYGRFRINAPQPVANSCKLPNKISLLLEVLVSIQVNEGDEIRDGRKKVSSAAGYDRTGQDVI